tara:strand:+ start:2636 stop:3052 length:417 start_codon:yes stop_codon:yes gene_type:complete
MSGLYYLKIIAVDIINTMSVYRLTCNITNEQYIGSTKNITQRQSTHKKLNCSSKQIILRGDYNFKILETNIDISELRNREQYHIDNTKCINKYNAVRQISKEEYNKADMAWRRKYWATWGGDKRTQNNLLLIDDTLFA